jgi:predicted RNA methylase
MFSPKEEEPPDLFAEKGQEEKAKEKPPQPAGRPRLPKMQDVGEVMAGKRAAARDALEKQKGDKGLENLLDQTREATDFRSVLAPDATSGAHVYANDIGRVIKSFLEAQGRMAGGGRRRWQENFSTAVAEQWKKDPDAVRTHAAHYIATMDTIRDAIAGAKNVKEIHRALRDAFYVGGDKKQGNTDLNREFLQYTKHAWWDRSLEIHEPELNKYTNYRDEKELPTGATPLRRPGLPVENIKRTGLTTYREGNRNISPNELREKFGFRGVEFGNWVSGGEGQAHLNAAYDALHDLADVLGVPPNAISLGGRLGLAFGSRGRGRHAAHFEPSNDVVNLTKTKGDGSLAHEWGHAFDYALRKAPFGADILRQINNTLQTTWVTPEQALGTLDNILRGNTFISNRKSLGPMETARKYVDSLWMHWGRRSTAFKSNADALGKDYWGKPEELIARSFESYIHDRMAEKGENSPYLVNDWVSEGKVSKDAGYRGTPYPTAAERKNFETMWNEVFRYLDWTEDGKPQVDTGKNAFNIPTGREELQGVLSSVDLDERMAELKRMDAHKNYRPPPEPAPVPEEAPAPASTYGKTNKVFTEDAAERARQILRQKLRGQLSAGIDPEIVQAGITLAGFHIEAGARSFADYAARMIEDMGEAVRPYLKSWYNAVRDYPDFDAKEMTPHAEMPTAEKAVQIEHEPVSPKDSGDAVLAEKIRRHLEDDIRPLNNIEMAKLAAEAYGGTAGEGKYDPRQAYDAMETGANAFIASHADSFDPRVGDYAAKKVAKLLRESIEDRLPVQNRRTGATDAFQQFSTPPSYAYAAAWAAHLKPEDVVLEPSAGNGNLAVWGKNAGAKVVGNELSEGRRNNLARLGLDAVLRHDAEQIDNLLPSDTKPNVVLMNPPFSSAGERGIRDSNITGRHIDQALERLAPGGRLVAITGENFVSGNSHNRPYFDKWGKDYQIKANIHVAGDVYKRYGTTYGTRVLVVDKVPPDGSKPVTGEAQSPEQVINLLKGVRDERPASEGRFGNHLSEQQLGEPQGKGPVAPERGGAGSDESLPPATGGEGVGRPGGGLPSGKAGQAAEHGGVAEGGASGEGPSVAASGKRTSGTGGRSGQRGGAGREPSGQPDERDSAGLSAAQSKPNTVTYEQGTSQPVKELAGGVYAVYKPQKLRIPGAQAHPADLVQSAAMASVDPPDPSYKPNLPKDAITKGQLSEAQLEPVVYAGQAHSKMLPDGNTRRGFFIGDGTGVGKGREISGIILDNMRQGRGKHVWISEKWSLLNDAKRDWTALGGHEKDLLNGKKSPMTGAIEAKKGIFFTTYDTLKQKPNPNRPKAGQRSRVDQLVSWLGKDFDGVIAFDEAHNMQNAATRRGSRGKVLPSEKALAGVDLQKQLPKARVVYVSATGATEVANLAYAERLGLWGPGTAFPTRDAFIAQIEGGGVAAMELVARDMKQLGLYMARGLSFEGVQYDRVEHKLSSDQRTMYDSLAGAWQHVLDNIDKALEITGGDKNGRTKSAAYSAFWGSHQRFFNQILTSMQMPTVLKALENNVKDGKAPVLQLVNTNEAAQERALANLSEEESLEDLDITPRDQLMQMVEHSFPVAAMEKFTDDNGVVRSRPVKDQDGNVVQDRRAVAMRDKLLDELGSIKVPDGPLEYLIDHFGHDKVSEVTGRTRRVIVKNGKRVVERRPASANTAEADLFMAGKKDMLVFSMAGGTGRSYHADLTVKNQKQRQHYLLQPGWSAAPAIQGFGRTHRSNQASKPFYHLVTTDVVGQKRFISSIARRLDQLGALTKGQRQTGGQGFFGERDNLESTYAQDAVTRLMTAIVKRDAEMQQRGLTPDVLTRQMGLRRLVDDNGNINVSEIPPITQFLNRLLSLKLEKQDAMFDAFDGYFDENLQAAAAAGTLDTGVEQLKADKITIKHEQPIHTDAETGAQTKYVELETQTATKPRDFDSISREVGRAQANNKEAFFAKNERSGRTYAFIQTRDKTDAQGRIEPQFRKIGPGREGIAPAHSVYGYEKFDSEDASRAAWEGEMARIPEHITSDVHMVAGALLPIWDRLPTGQNQVYRAITDDGHAILGRVIPPDLLKQTLTRLGAEGRKITMTPDQIFSAVLDDGNPIELANGWRLTKRMVSGEPRLRIIGPDLYNERMALERAGAQFERIGYEGFLFVPRNDRGRAFLEAQLKRAPIARVAADEDGMDVRRAQVLEQKRAQVAYHGSPHDFDEFRNEAIGTGEGAQAFGYGHYFAGKKGVAEYYRDALTKRNHTVEYNGLTITRNGKPLLISEDWRPQVESLIKFASERGLKDAKAIGAALADPKSAKGWWDRHLGDFGAAVRVFHRLMDKGGFEISDTRKGKLYTVDLAPKEEEYLDWDKPIGQQSEHVKKALTAAGLYKDTADRPRWDEELDGRIAYKDFNGSDAGFTLGYIRPNRKIGGYDVHHPHGPNGWGGQDHGYSGHAPTLDAAKKWIERAVPDKAWQAGQGALPASYFYRQLAMQHGRIVPLGSDGARWDVNSPDPRAASAALHAAGIPGIRYLDNVSRGQGEGSRNYVVFDPQHIKIEKKAQIGPFYSALTRAVENAKTERAPASQWESTIKNLPSIKEEEVQWSGVREFLADQKGPVAKADLLNFLRENEVRVEEVEKGAAPGNRYEARQRDGVWWTYDTKRQRWVDDHFDEDGAREYAQDLNSKGVDGATKFSQYALPGGQNYRELLLTLPAKRYWVNGDQITAEDLATAHGRAAADRVGSYGDDVFTSSHWDEPNVLAHVRFDDRTGPNGEKILHVAEIQSDWHQKGRREGYRGVNAEQQYDIYKDGRAVATNLTEAQAQAWQQANRANGPFEVLEGNRGAPGGVPNAPFKSTWHELAMKRILRYASEQASDVESGNWRRIVKDDPDKAAHMLVKSGILKEICD